MTDDTACPDLAVLSQFLDHELEADMEQTIGKHLETCPKCQTQVARIGQAEKMARTALFRSTVLIPPQTSLPECLSPAEVSAYVQRVLSAEEAVRAERHLQHCDACVHEVRGALQISSVLATAKKVPVPADLKARVASLWESLEEEKTVSFSRLVIHIAQKGLKLLEQHLTPPLLDVQEFFTPMPAYRGEEGGSALNLQIHSQQAEIKAIAVHEGDGVALSMTFLDASQEALIGQRVFLRQQGRPIFSARTDHAGILRMPHLKPGVYEVACPGIHTTFQLELHP